MARKKENQEKIKGICALCAGVENLIEANKPDGTLELVCKKCAKKVKIPNPEAAATPAKTQQEICDECEDRGLKCLSCNSRQNDVEKPATEPEKKADITPPAAPEIPIEYTNYRNALRDLLREGDALEYRIASLKTQLKANEKAIENINRQFVTGEYTGELFQNKTDVSDAAPGSLAKREDAPDFDEYLVMVGENLSELADLETPLDNQQTMKAALYDFITSNPDSSTARLLYGKVTFKPALFAEGEEPGEGEEKEYDHFIIPEFDDRTDFITAFVIEDDRAKYNERLEIWKKIQVEKQNESEAE